ncbi:indolethylamine N-methyltransferase-like [Pelodytes ibericus]
MESEQHKHYHDEEYDPHLIIDTYVAANCTGTREELLEYPLEMLFQELSSGNVKGDSLIDITIGPAFSHLTLAADYFKEITILDSSDKNIDESKRWLNKEPGAVDWSHGAMHACKLKGDKERWQEQEEKVREVVKRVIKFDATKEYPLDTEDLPQADCLLSVWYLDAACRDQESYLSNIRKLSSLLKVGGHFILFGLLNASYYMIGDHRFSMLTYDEGFIRKALSDNGLIIENSNVCESKVSTDLVDYKQIGFFVARKEKEN